MQKISCIILLVFAAISCQSPLDVRDADRDFEFLNDPTDGSEIFVITPKEIDFGIVHPQSEASYKFSVQNISKKNQKLTDVYLKDFPQNYDVLDLAELPMNLTPINTSADKVTFNLQLNSQSPGVYNDTLKINDLRLPKLTIKAMVPELYGTDKEKNLSVGELDIIAAKLINASDHSITVTSIQMDEISGVFSFEPALQLPIEIAAYGEVLMPILFAPKSAQTYETIIYIQADTPLLDPEIIITGNGL